MRIAVTGAGGFIGRHAVADLAQAGHEVLALAHRPANIAGAAATFTDDVAAAQTWAFAAEADAIVHLAGISDASLSRDRPLDYNLANAVGTLLGLEAARRNNTPFLLASSQRVYRSSCEPVRENSPLEPNEPYGYSKLVAEQWLMMYRRLFGLPATVVRFFSVYGPGQIAGKGASGVAAIFVERALRGADLVVDTAASRDFTYVDDAVRGIRLILGVVADVPVRHGPADVPVRHGPADVPVRHGPADVPVRHAPADADPPASVYNIATGRATSMRALAETVIEVTGSTSRIVEADGNQPSESYVADIARARAELGYHPRVDLREGLRRYVASMRA